MPDVALLPSSGVRKPEPRLALRALCRSLSRHMEERHVVQLPAHLDHPEGPSAEKKRGRDGTLGCSIKGVLGLGLEVSTQVPRRADVPDELPVCFISLLGGQSPVIQTEFSEAPFKSWRVFSFWPDFPLGIPSRGLKGRLRVSSPSVMEPPMPGDSSFSWKPTSCGDGRIRHNDVHCLGRLDAVPAQKKVSR